MTGSARDGHFDRRASGVIALVALMAWIAILVGFNGDEAGIVGFVAAWTVMMVAMMLPSAMPFILLYQRGASRRATIILAAGYTYGHWLG